MKSHLVVFAAVALCHFTVADIVRHMENFGPSPSLAQEVIGNIIDLVTGDVEVSPHIVGGGEVVPHSHPHQVALFCYLKTGEQALCGGSLITPDWVLTAAHCLEDVEEVKVLLGSHNITTGESERQTIPANTLVPHAWNPQNNVNDIALLKLARPATLNQYVQSIRLPSTALKEKSLTGTPIVLTGWGRYSDNSEDTSPVLRSVESTVVMNSYCNTRYGGEIKNTMVCADGRRARGVCNGDSGGPMVMTESDGQKTIIGVTSFGRKEGCEKNFPTVFTRVDQYLEWISEHTGVTLRRN